MMPNHFHGIIGIKFQTEESINKNEQISPDFKLKAKSLGSIIGQFKSISTKKINKCGLPNF